MGFLVTIPLGLVSSIHGSTPSSAPEVVIQRTIEGIQRMIGLHNNEGEQEKGITTEAPIQISLAAKRHWQSEIKVLREAPRDPEKLTEILKVKQKQYEKAKDSEDIERLIPEIEMLKFVLYVYRQK